MGVDELAKQSSSEAGPTDTNQKIEVQKHPNIEEIPTFAIQSGNSWMTLILSFLQDGRLPQDTEEAKKVRKRVARFTILNGTLYKRSFSMPYLKCVNEEEARYILEEIHEGICRDHAGPRSLRDANEFFKKYDRCQRFGNFQHIPSERLTTITSPRPFAQWEFDIVRPLPQGKRQVGWHLQGYDQQEQQTRRPRLPTSPGPPLPGSGSLSPLLRDA
ncbi:uncharacterized protein LOC142634594 [Castanea sativa]|uniref:uncharacterized protein LOC142634594 n=1 Tax=Castanea sativa TaxID=21020 RepID=UPI003F654542